RVPARGLRRDPRDPGDAQGSREIAVKYMILVKCSPADDKRGFVWDDGAKKMFDEMGAFHDEMQKAGIVVDFAGLKPTRDGARITYGKGGKRTVIDGPFTESKEIVAGYTIIDVKSHEEAMSWAKRYPNPSANGGESEIEVRPFYSNEDIQNIM